MYIYIYVYLVKNKTWHPSKQRQPWNQVNVTRRAPHRPHNCLEIALVDPTPELPNEQLLPVGLCCNHARPHHAVTRLASLSTATAWARNVSVPKEWDTNNNMTYISITKYVLKTYIKTHISQNVIKCIRRKTHTTLCSDWMIMSGWRRVDDGDDWTMMMVMTPIVNNWHHQLVNDC